MMEQCINVRTKEQIKKEWLFIGPSLEHRKKAGGKKIGWAKLQA
jgi:hypothetical protein